MDYQIGLDNLRKRISKTSHDATLRKLNVLENQLINAIKAHEDRADISDISNSLNHALAELDRFAKRSVAVAFSDLCESTSNNKPQFPLSIRGVLILIISILILPAMGIAATTYVKENNQLSQFVEIQQDIQKIDSYINNDVSSPYYLAPMPDDPCRKATIDKIVTWNDFSIDLAYPSQDSLICAWEYYLAPIGEIIVKDYWGGIFHELKMREYYQDNALIARDDFDFNRYDCVKERSYVGIDLVECYSETGKLLSIDPQGTWVSPVPPMVYWFFYR